MESLGQVLKRLTGLPISASLLASEDGPVGDGTCRTCRGQGFVSKRVDIYHPDFGKAFVCPTCKNLRNDESRKDARKRWAGITPGLSQKTFASFLNASGATAEAAQICMDYANGDLETPWLFLWGPYGTGKSHLAVAILNWRLEHQDTGPMGQYIKVADWFGDLQKGFKDDTYYDVLEATKRTPLLIIDELSVQANKAGQTELMSWQEEKLWQVIDHRAVERLETVFTTNLYPPWSQLNPRIADRLADTGTGLVRIVEIKERSYRSGKAW